MSDITKGKKLEEDDTEGNKNHKVDPEGKKVEAEDTEGNWHRNKVEDDDTEGNWNRK